MHLYLTYKDQIIEVLYASLETLTSITDRLSALKSKYPEFSEIQITYTETKMSYVNYKADLVDEAVSYLKALNAKSIEEMSESLAKIEKALNDQLDMSTVMLLHNHRDLRLSMKIAGRQNEFKIEPIGNGRINVKHVVQSLRSEDRFEFDSAEDLAKELLNLQLVEKRARELFFSGTRFTSAYEV